MADDVVTRFGPTRRGGPIFRWLGEPLAIDLANTVMVVRESEQMDLLATREDLRHWLKRERKRLGDWPGADEHLDEIRLLRDAVRELLASAVWGAALPSTALDRVNEVSAEAPVAPQLEIVAEGGFEVREHPTGGGPKARFLGQLARSTIALLASPERERLHICKAPSCGMFFLGNRRWCCSACGNRARAARHYRRTRAPTDAPGEK